MQLIIFDTYQTYNNKLKDENYVLVDDIGNILPIYCTSLDQIYSTKDLKETLHNKNFKSIEFDGRKIDISSAKNNNFKILKNNLQKFGEPYFICSRCKQKHYANAYISTENEIDKYCLLCSSIMKCGECKDIKSSLIKYNSKDNETLKYLCKTCYTKKIMNILIKNIKPEFSNEIPPNIKEYIPDGKIPLIFNYKTNIIYCIKKNQQMSDIHYIGIKN